MGPSTDRYSAREFHSTRQGRTGAYKGTERTLQPLPLASGPPHTPTWPDSTGLDQWLSYRGPPRAAVAGPLRQTRPRRTRARSRRARTLCLDAARAAAATWSARCPARVLGRTAAPLAAAGATTWRPARAQRRHKASDRGHSGPRRGRIGLRRRFKRRPRTDFYAHEAPMAPLEGPVGRTGGPRGRETHKRLPACSENEHAGSRTAHEPASASWRLACCTRQVRCIRGSIDRFQWSSRRRARLARRHAADSVLRAAHCSPTTEMACPGNTK